MRFLVASFVSSTCTDQQKNRLQPAAPIGLCIIGISKCHQISVVGRFLSTLWYVYDTVDGCKILHHLDWMVETCWNPMNNGITMDKPSINGRISQPSTVCKAIMACAMTGLRNSTNRHRCNRRQPPGAWCAIGRSGTWTGTNPLYQKQRHTQLGTPMEL